MSVAAEVKADRRVACKLPDKITSSGWAESKRVLSAKAGAAEPGPWRANRTPYAVEPMDAICGAVEQVVLMWSTQIGKSTMIENVIGYWVEEDPGPLLYVMPTESSIKETLEERLRPLIDDSLSDHIVGPDSIQQTGIKFDTMRVHFGWSGSPNSLARRSCRYVLFDECDKFVPFAGKEADPISLGEQRVTTYGHRARIIKVSTPTTRDGAIWKAWEGCGDKRRFHVPCPHCGTYQLLTFPQVRWEKQPGGDKAKIADKIEMDRLAWFECIACKQKILDHHKPKMLMRGKWGSEGQEITKDGTITGERPKSNRIGYHLSSLYSPWVKWSKIAAQFIRADGDPGKTMNFRNSWLAEPFEDQISKVQPGMIREKSQLSPAAGTVPKWTQALFSLVDTQKDWFKVHVRAWGWGYRSQLVYEGVCQTFEEVRRVGLQSQFNVDGGGLATPSHQLIDSGGSRTDEVYQYALSEPGRIIPTKGASHQMRRPYSITKLPNGLTLILFDTGFYKDMLTRLIQDPDPTKWLPHRDVSDQYCLEMASEHKILDRKANRMLWLPVSAGVRNESWDCEVLACVAADMANIGAMPAEVPASAATVKAADNPLNYRGRW